MGGDNLDENYYRNFARSEDEVQLIMHRIKKK